MPRLFTVLLVVASLLLTSCGQVAEKAVEQATGIQTDKKGESVTIKGKDGENVVIKGGDQVPSEFKDFPVLSGFKYEGGGSISSGDGKMAVANWKGKGTLQTASDFYKKALADRGWKEESSFDVDSGGQRTYSKGDEALILSISTSGDDLDISVIQSKIARTPTP